jgi:rare lipoprotein A
MTPSVARVGLLAAAFAAGLLGGCAQTQFVAQAAKEMSGATERPAGAYKVGQPYEVDGVWYYPAVDYDYDHTGIASWYGPDFHGKLTANGEIYDMNELTAAHPTLPMPSFVRVTNLENGRSLVLKVNDRGPFVRGRIVDVSRRGSQLLGFYGKGTAMVRVQILADESRAIAARLNGENLAKAASPITVDRLPKAAVTAERLPPLGNSAPPSRPAPALAPAAASAGDARDAGGPAFVNPVSGKVAQAPVGGSTQLYVQAGAFGFQENATRVGDRLARVGPVKLSPVRVNGRDLYRVRIGPLASLEEADRTLDSVVRAGYPDARIIVD